MTKVGMNPFLLRSNARLFAGMFVTPLSLFSIVVILAFNPHPLFAIFPIPTLMIGTAMITLELRNHIEQHGPIVHRADTSAESKLPGSKLASTMVENVGQL